MMDLKSEDEIKREPYTPPDHDRRRRLRSPMILADEKVVKPKRSRLSSPVIIDNDRDFDRRQTVKPDPDDRRRRRRSPYRSRRDRSEFDEKPRHLDKKKPDPKPAPKDQVNFELSGKLAADTNSYKGVVIKYNEPEDARKPTQFWRLYPFKGQDALKVMHIHRQSGYLIGSDRRICEIPMLHPSISKQHAVLQFRFVSLVLFGYIFANVIEFFIVVQFLDERKGTSLRY